MPVRVPRSEPQDVGPSSGPTSDREPIVLELDGESRLRGYLEPIAECGLWTSWRSTPRAVPSGRPERDHLDLAGPWSETFDGLCLDSGLMRRVVAFRDVSGRRRVDFDDGETYVVAPGGSGIRRFARPGSSIASRPSAERTFGGPLALGLALRGVHLLHASAIAAGERAVALTAPSGVGKSTLAAAADGSRTTWKRLADDILPVRLSASSVALPLFPQLKLAASRWWPARGPSRLRLVAVIALERRSDGGTIELQPLGPAEAAVTLTGAVVASRLFDDELLERQLAACTVAAGSLRLARLTYPSGAEPMVEVLSELERFL